MWPASAGFISRVRSGTFTAAFKVEWLNRDLSLRADVTSEVLDGTIALSAAREGRRDCSLVVRNPGGVNTPTGFDAPFMVTNLFRVSHGVVFPGGAVEYVPTGTFRINRPWARSGADQHELEVGAMDLWLVMQQTAFPDPIVYAAGSTLDAIVRDVISRCGLPAPVLDGNASSLVIRVAPAPDLVVDPGTDMASVASTVLQAFGYQYWFDPAGIFVARSFAALQNQTPLDAIADTDASTEHIDGGFEDSPDVKNSIGVRGVGTGTTPVYVRVEDTIDGSFTRADGPFGRRYWEYSDPSIQTTAIATSVGQDFLQRKLLLSRSAEVFGRALVWLDGLDVVSLTSSELKVKGGKYVVDQMTIPLDLQKQGTLKLNEARPIL